MKLAIATLSSMLLFSSMNLAVEAAPSPIVKDIAVKTAAAKALTAKEKMEKEEMDRLDKILEKNPDDTYCVYVSNDKSKKSGLEFFYMGASSPEFNTYADYMKKASTLKGTVLQQPSAMPEEYTFAKGGIHGEIDQRFQKELKAEAKKKGKEVYSKKYNWSKADSIKLEYTNGENNLIMSYIAFDPKGVTIDQKGYSYQSSAEIIKKNPKFANNPELIRNTLIWFEKGKQFTITTNPENPLTKEKLIKLAETMVRK